MQDFFVWVIGISLGLLLVKAWYRKDSHTDQYDFKNKINNNNSKGSNTNYSGNNSDFSSDSDDYTDPYDDEDSVESFEMMDDLKDNFNNF